MRRLSLVLALVAALVVAAALPAGAAPAKTGTELDLECEDPDPDITVLVQFESSAAAVFDLESNGRRYVLSGLDFRVWAGDLASEPTVGDPVFQEMKTWGKRIGYNETLTCKGSLVQTFPEGTFTSFFDIVASGK